LSVLQRGECEPASAGDEQVEHGPAQAQAARLARESTDNPCSKSPDLRQPLGVCQALTQELLDGRLQLNARRYSPDYHPKEDFPAPGTRNFAVAVGAPRV